MTDKRQAWTAEPWEVEVSGVEVSGGEAIVNIHSADHWYIATMWGLFDEDDDGRIHAARIVACVNAMAGIPDPAEWRRQSRELAEVVDRLWEERDERVREGLICDAIARADDLLALDPTHE